MDQVSSWGRDASRAVRFLSRSVFVLTLGCSGAASAILTDRGPDLVYDTVLNITWTREAGDGVYRTWANANAWAGALVFAGFADWRLPYASVVSSNNWRFTFPAAGRRATGLNLLERLSASSKLLHDRFDGRGPHERLGVFIPGFKKLLDRELQISDACKCTAPHRLIRELRKPALHEVQP